LTDLLLIIIAVELLAIVVVLVSLGNKTNTVNTTLEEIARATIPKKPGGHHGFDVLECAAFAIWCYTKGKWVLLAKCGQPGCDCGPPPAVPGNYEEQVIRKECPPVGRVVGETKVAGQ
jgi:hypothetical protein